MLKTIQDINNFEYPPADGCGLPLTINNQPIGFIRSSIIQHLPSSIFKIHADKIEFADVADKTSAVADLLSIWRASTASIPEFQCLKGWRNEVYAVYENDGSVVFGVERAAQGLFGIRSYGCHLNGYVRDLADGSIKMWIAKRSLQKQTWPGYLDNIVGGGLPAGASPTANMIKECAEEASIPGHIASKCIPVSSISYFANSPSRGLLPDTEYIYDLELTADFIPKPSDGEVDSFYLWDLETIARHVVDGKFMPESGCVVIDFLVRHGHVTPENEVDYLDIVTELRRKLPFPGPKYK
ncbi:hypothetical protein SmJEL517_g03226 [Synchytrium microbalum]|uniref:Nudix hydrolase domain-containing protein n=1 Tax=Synchytrium microbalum TaxID=1806994 RepID=A0A507C3F4_9FUNG|nr:uncharacterized protein SmJEL517_g03226 [Synchytrium microbalum]TPX33991.1 hypothetical protein SmJEL517_g03226 [Synchytrium microbalum]